MLDGITVLDLSSVGPGSRCTWLLADLGADVVKIVAPPSAGRIDPPFHSYGAGRGTRRTEIDLKTNKDAFLDLAADADVVVESYRPGVADRLGIGYDAVRARNPTIVYAAITGYGQTGPMASWAGHDVNYLGVAGLLAAQGNALAGATVADSAGGGMQAAISILAALLRRDRTGEGAYLDVSTTNGVLYLMALQIDQYLATGEESAPGTTLLTGRYACYGVYECRDGKWLSVAAIESQFFHNLCRALECEQLAEHQYDDKQQDEIRATFAATFATKNRDDWVAELAPLDTCVAPVLDVSEVASRFPELVQEATHPEHGSFEQLGPLIAR
ncbi:MAG TPA: CoA transferase [Actinomycetota bacterium]|jgi:alpha-methylacyl-CoA racemase|nr:CoA transferase [Actinomycetota bacterium]